MKMQHELKYLALGVLAGAAVAAQAAPSYSLTCESARGQSFTVALTSFSFHVGGTTEASTGAASGKRSTSELIIRFPTNTQVYEALLTAAEGDEVLRSCRLSEGSGGTAAADNWNNMTSSSTNKKKKGVDSGSARGTGTTSAGSGSMEWILNNATVSGVTALETDGMGTAGVQEALVQATIVAQNFTFSPR